MSSDVIDLAVQSLLGKRVVVSYQLKLMLVSYMVTSMILLCIKACMPASDSPHTALSHCRSRCRYRRI